MIYAPIYPWWYPNWTARRPRSAVKVVWTVAEPMIPLDVLRQQCEVVPIDGDSDSESHPDDALLLGYLEAAVEAAEDFTGLSIALRTYELGLDTFPWSSSTYGSAYPNYGIDIPRPPLIRIDSFTAVGGGSEGELDENDDYLVDDFSFPARLVPVAGWPTITPAANAIRVRYTAGYLPIEGSDSDFTTSDYAGAQPLPAVIKMALLLLVGHFYANREDSIDKVLSTIPHGFHDLLRPRRILLGMA